MMDGIAPIGPCSSKDELENWNRLLHLFQNQPVPSHELIANIGLYMPRQVMMRLLFFHELYQKIISTHGVIMEFGCKWGVNLAYLTALRGIYEPYNHNRRIIAFDTFSGLTGVTDKDGTSPLAASGNYATSPGYEKHLQSVLECLESFCPLDHIRKFELVSGDVRETTSLYLKRNPQTVVSFAYFDMDLYEPTKVALEAILPHVTKGTVLGFDEMNWCEMPGPALALQEVLGFRRYKIMHSIFQPIPGYVVVE
jgi:hypothetical protein